MKKRNLIDSLQLDFALKIGVAATIGLFLGVGFSQILDRPDALVSGMWTVVTAILVVQAHLGGTYIAASVRFLGTVIGTVMAGLCTTFLGSNAISLGISNFITVAFCYLVNLKDSVRIASLTVTILMVLWRLQPEISPWAFGFFRLMDSCLGIMVAVIVTHTVFPIDDTKKIKDSLWLALQKLEWIYRDCLHKPLDNENRVVKWAREINQHINEARIIFEESKSEIMRKNPIEDWGFFLDHVERAYEAVLDLRDIKHRPSNDFLYTHFLSNIRKTTEEIVFAIEDFILSLEGKDVKNVYDLRDALALMNHELVQFKENQFQQIQNPDEWQNLFVFAYALRVLGNELLTIKEKAIPLSNH